MNSNDLNSYWQNYGYRGQRRWSDDWSDYRNYDNYRSYAQTSPTQNVPNITCPPSGTVVFNANGQPTCLNCKGDAIQMNSPTSQPTCLNGLPSATTVLVSGIAPQYIAPCNPPSILNIDSTGKATCTQIGPTAPAAPATTSNPEIKSFCENSDQFKTFLCWRGYDKYCQNNGLQPTMDGYNQWAKQFKLTQSYYQTEYNNWRYRPDNYFYSRYWNWRRSNGWY
jgi:hypothetical protein